MRIHGHPIEILPGKGKEDVGGVDGAVGRVVLADRENERGRQAIRIVEHIVGIGIELDFGLRYRVSEVIGFGDV